VVLIISAILGRLDFQKAENPYRTRGRKWLPKSKCKNHFGAEKENENFRFGKNDF
jgi:hypothetical protein